MNAVMGAIADAKSPAQERMVHLFDRHDRDGDLTGTQLKLRLDQARGWCAQRGLLVVGEHVAPGPCLHADVLAEAVDACLRERTLLIVWGITSAIPEFAVRRLVVRELGRIPLIDARHDHRLMAADNMILPVPTGYPVVTEAGRARWVTS